MALAIQVNIPRCIKNNDIFVTATSGTGFLYPRDDCRAVKIAIDYEISKYKSEQLHEANILMNKHRSMKLFCDYLSIVSLTIFVVSLLLLINKNFTGGR